MSLKGKRFTTFGAYRKVEQPTDLGLFTIMELGISKTRISLRWSDIFRESMTHSLGKQHMSMSDLVTAR